MQYLVLIACFVYPAALLIFSRNKPDGFVARYLIPHFLPFGLCTRRELRQAGIGWLVFSIWLLVTAVSISLFLPKATPGHFELLLAVCGFLVPLVAFVLFIAGLYYLIAGIFSRSDKVAPALQPITEAMVEYDKLGIYVRRVIRWNIIGTVIVVLLVGSLVAGNLLDESIRGMAGLMFGLSVVAAFVTSSRLQTCMELAILALGEHGCVLRGPIIAIPLLSWFQAIAIRNRYRRLQESPDFPR